MTVFAIHNAREEDLLTYPDFFAQAPLFNTLNQPAQPQAFDQNLIARMTSRSAEKLVFWDHQPVFYLGYKKSPVVHTIETMIYDARVELDQAALIDFIRSELFEKSSLKLVHNKFDYYTCDHKKNEAFLEQLGFVRTKNHRIMNLLTEGCKPSGRITDDDILIYPVKTTVDMNDRVRIQNLVFQNKKRVPLVLLDVQSEMRNKSYLPDLSLLLSCNGEPCGYGQLVSNRSTTYLVNFGITPDFQGRGLAHRLLDELLILAKEKGISQIMLEVYEDNFKAIGLYEKHGFKTLYNKSLWSYR